MTQPNPINPTPPADKERLLKFASRITGTFSRETQELFWTCLEELTSKTLPRIVEIGTYFGRSSSILVGWGAIHPCLILLVDCRWEGPPGARESTFAILQHYGYRSPDTIHWRHPITGTQVIVAEEYSVDAWKNYPQFQAMDFLHIDAEHTEKGVLGDSCWVASAKSGIPIVFHDYQLMNSDGTPTFPGYSEAIDSIVEGFMWLGLADTLLAVRKP